MGIDPALYQKYNKEKVDKAVELLNYKNVATLPKTEIAGKPTLFVFRHGQSVDNEKMLFSGWRDVDLTKKGEEQAMVLAEKLADKKIDLLIASDLKRSIRTMEIAISKNRGAKKLPIIQDPRIKERSYGDLQGTSKLEISLSNPELAHSYRRSYDVIPPNGENLEIVVKRVYSFIEEILPKMVEFNLNVAVSSHANSIRGFRKYFEHLTNEETALIETPLANDYPAYCVV